MVASRDKRHASSGLDLAARLAGAIWGHLVGDAVGVPYEFRPAVAPDTVEFGAKGTWGQPPGTWSDDGALMLALLDSLLSAGFDSDDQARRAVAWYHHGAYTPDGDGRFDVGTTTSEALRALDAGTPAVDAGPSHDDASGNGSLMRILPLGLVEHDLEPAKLIEQAHLASRVTHGHPRCQVACAVYTLVVRELLRDRAPADALRVALSAVRDRYASDPELTAHLVALDELEAWPGRSGRGFVVDSFWSAWDAFAGADGFEATIRRAVAYGRDTDTTAAIAGGLAGAYWGWRGIPRTWLRRMRGREVATPLVDRLVETAGWRTSTSHPLRIDRLDLSGLDGLQTSPGGLGITFLPGKKRSGWTGPWWRDLDLDLAALRAANVDTLFLLVEDDELDDCLVEDIEEVMADAGPELIRFPVRDPRTPLPHQEGPYRAAVRDLVDRVRRGQFVAIACRGGLDRSGMTAACFLREAGLPADEAIGRVHRARGSSLTYPEQVDYVRGW